MPIEFIFYSNTGYETVPIQQKPLSPTEAFGILFHRGGQNGEQAVILRNGANRGKNNEWILIVTTGAGVKETYLIYP